MEVVQVFSKGMCCGVVSSDSAAILLVNPLYNYYLRIVVGSLDSYTNTI
jgi:hypothetical protein